MGTKKGQLGWVLTGLTVLIALTMTQGCRNPIGTNPVTPNLITPTATPTISPMPTVNDPTPTATVTPTP